MFSLLKQLIPTSASLTPHQQCVGGSLQDAFTKGYDCILLADGSATTSPAGAQESIEFNCAKTWGFCMTCEMFAEGVSKMEK
jgi:nicotinamidase-related amidase